MLNKTEEEAEEIADFYDVLEIQPLTMYMHLVDKGLVGSPEEIKTAISKVVRIGEN